MIKISGELTNKLEKIAELHYPYECCGILLGKLNGEDTIIMEIKPMKNIAENPLVTYTLDPLELIKIDDEYEDKKIEMIGIYHSHPNHPDEPSETDVKYAWPNIVYFIISVYEGKFKSMNAWKLNKIDKKKFERIKISTLNSN